MNIFEDRESVVRTYCRAFPVVFKRAKGAFLYDTSGRRYIDFFAGAGALNYGHNHDFIKQRLLEYIKEDGVIHALDLHTTAKAKFLESFVTHVMAPAGLDYKVMFCGPTGTNSIESALKLARKVTGRPGIFSFMGGYHGMSLGSLAATGNAGKRKGSGVPLNNVTFLPYPVMPANLSLFSPDDTINFIENILEDSHSGIERPAAVLFETVQAEGGINVAPTRWICALKALCERNEILLICDDIQAGCGRTGPFFSFERAGIFPDMITVSKSISGYGAPMSLLLIRRDLDIWKPGEHNGTFRGYQLAMVGATAALELREILDLTTEVQRKERFIESFLHSQLAPIDTAIEIRGVGMIWGIDFSQIKHGESLCRRVSERCFELGLIIETAGRNDTVLKLLPSLTIEDHLLEQGCVIIKRAMEECLFRSERVRLANGVSLHN